MSAKPNVARPRRALVASRSIMTTATGCQCSTLGGLFAIVDPATPCYFLPVANVICVLAPEWATAFAPAGSENSAAAFGVAAVKLDEVVAAFADVVWMRIDGRPAAFAVRRVIRRSLIWDGPTYRNLTTPCASNHRTDGEAIEVDRRSEHRRRRRHSRRSEETIGCRDSTVVALPNPARTRKVGDGEPAEVDGREVRRVEAEVRRGGLRRAVDRRLSPVARHAQRPRARVRRHERIRDLERQLARTCVRARRQGGREIHQPEPEAVTDHEPCPPRVLERKEERRRDGLTPRSNGPDQVHAG